MIQLLDVGGVSIFGVAASAWINPDARFIRECRVEFDSEVSSPDVDTGSFLFPAYRGQNDYQVHLLENGGALVVKEDRVYLCVTVEGMPRVITFVTVPADQRHVQHFHNMSS